MYVDIDLYIKLWNFAKRPFKKEHIINASIYQNILLQTLSFDASFFSVYECESQQIVQECELAKKILKKIHLYALRMTIHELVVSKAKHRT